MHCLGAESASHPNYPGPDTRPGMLNIAPEMVTDNLEDTPGEQSSGDRILDNLDAITRLMDEQKANQMLFEQDFIPLHTLNALNDRVQDEIAQLRSQTASLQQGFITLDDITGRKR